MRKLLLLSILTGCQIGFAGPDSGSCVPEPIADASHDHDAHVAADAGHDHDAAHDASHAPDADHDAAHEDRDAAHDMDADVHTDPTHDAGHGTSDFFLRVSEGYSTVRISNTTEKPSVGDGVGAFRTVCEVSHFSYDDPIVYPGMPGRAHLHMFFGNTETDAYSTHDSLLQSGNSTCRGGIMNRSGYWVPTLLDQAGEIVYPLQVTLYYKTGYYGVDPQDIQVIPEGLMMLAGDMYATGDQVHAFWGCANGYEGHFDEIHQCSGGGPIELAVNFPQCWDGVNLDSADHKSHMAYPAQGPCPRTHPVALPVITVIASFPQHAGGIAGYHLSSDHDNQRPGQSLHADWLGAWQPEHIEWITQYLLQAGLDGHAHLMGNGKSFY